MLDTILAERETIRLRHAQARLLDRAGRYEEAPPPPAAATNWSPSASRPTGSSRACWAPPSTP
jgi:hypothetical protein